MTGTALTFKEGVWTVRLAADSGCLLQKAGQKVRRYFEKGRPIGKIPLHLAGETPFQKRVLRAAQKIPFGEVRSYGWLARQIGLPGAARACGQALRRNRFLLFVPCHRVVGQSGVGGFSCGVWLKKKLLQHEQMFVRRKGL